MKESQKLNSSFQNKELAEQERIVEKYGMIHLASTSGGASAYCGKT